MRSRLSLSVLVFLSAQVAWAQMEEFLVNTFTTGDQSRPAAAMDPLGNFVVVWESSAQDGSGTGIFGQRYDGEGTPVGPEFLVNSVTTFSQSRPSAAMDDSGRIVIVWQGPGDGSDTGVFARHFDANGNPLGLDFQVNADTDGAQVEPDVAVDDEGGFTFVWQSRLPGTYSEIRARHFDATGSPSGEEFKISLPGVFVFDTDSPAVATGSDGVFVVAYHAEYYHDVLIRPSRGNCTFGVARGDAGFDVEMAPSGEYVVASVPSAPRSGGDIEARRYNRCNASGPEIRVNSYPENGGRTPRVAGDASGGFIVTWVSIGDGSGDIFARRFNSQGEPLGDEYLVNSFSVGEQSAPAIAMNGRGRPILVWQDSAHDGSGFGIYARLEEEMNPRSIPTRLGDGVPLERTPRPIDRLAPGTGLYTPPR